jgi:Effector-associated domain 11
MRITEQIQMIRDLVGVDDLKNAIDKLRQLSEGSSVLNGIILQSAKLNDIQKQVVFSKINYNDESIAKAQIRASILSLIDEVQLELAGKTDVIQKEIDLSLFEIIRKHGVNETAKQKINSLKKDNKTYYCLWIDEDHSNDQMELQALTGIGLECRTATNPYKAYQIMKREKPDIIIMNSLKGLKDNRKEGIEFCAYLYSLSKYKAIPIIMHSLSLYNDIKQKKIALIDLPPNIKNRFSEKDSLIVRDLIEEVIDNLK